MKRTMTNFEVIKVMDILNGFANKNYPFQLTRAIVKTLKNLNAEYEIYYKKYKEIVDKYFEVDERCEIKMDKNGQRIVKEGIDELEANEALVKLLNENVEDIEIVQCKEDIFNDIHAISPDEYTFFDHYLIKEG